MLRKGSKNWIHEKLPVCAADSIFPDGGFWPDDIKGIRVGRTDGDNLTTNEEFRPVHYVRSCNEEQVECLLVFV